MVDSKPARPIVAVLADTDSRWKWGMATALALSPGSLRLFCKTGPAAPTSRQLNEVGVQPDAVESVTISAFARALASDECDVAVIALGGDGCQAVQHAMAALEWPRRRPLTVCGYVGLVYREFVEGVLLRSGCDVILVNSAQDAARFRRILNQHDLDPGAIVEAPLPFLGTPATTTPAEFTLTFAAQPDVPSSRAEREYIVKRLAAHARRFPSRRVVLKVRGQPGEQLTHPEPYPFHRLLTKLGSSCPANLELLSGPMSEALDRTSLLVTVSSTAAAESIHRGIPTVALTDFGIREKLGNTFFGGSGCLASFDEIDNGAAPIARPEWARTNGMLDGNHGAFRLRIEQLLGEPRRPITPSYAVSKSSYFLPRLLANHGLAPDGTPLLDPGQESRLRKGIRSMSQLLYRKGVNVVAPALRRLGSA